MAASPLERAAELVKQMTLKEKLSMMSGKVDTYVGNVNAIERLGIPPLYMQDGPQGFRVTGKTGEVGSTTAWPSEMTIGSSFDTELAERWAAAMAQEFKGKGANMLLGPGIGIARVPNAGRNFEYLSGEDPVLGSLMVRAVVKGIQDQGIIANAKHWVNNEIETHRMLVSANVDLRTRREIYYPPFQAAVDAGVLSVMCSYNRINDVYSCQNNETLGHLKNDMGFKGFVVSDWFAAGTTSQALKAGLDLEMPVGLYFAEAALEAAVARQEISIRDIDDAVRRILYAMISAGILDNPAVGNPLANVTSDEHNALSREIAAKSTVLLKNEGGILPLEKFPSSSCIAVFGNTDVVTGGGSGNVKPAYVVSPAQGIEAALAGSGISVIYNPGTDLTEAASLAAKCRTAIVAVATTSHEGADRESLSLGDGQDDLVTAIAAANKRTVVLVNAPGAVLLPWADSVPAILVSWLPGQEFGNAVADVLFGAINPSARLPLTLPNKENEVGFTPEMFPGVGTPHEATYTEELLIGYR